MLDLWPPKRAGSEAVSLARWQVLDLATSKRVSLHKMVKVASIWKKQSEISRKQWNLPKHSQTVCCIELTGYCEKKTDSAWMRAALALANEARLANEVPVGAIVVLDGQIVGKGHNRVIADCDPTAHAEIVALRSAALQTSNYRMPEAELYVTLEPCAMCAGAIIQARIRRVVFGALDPKSGAAGSVLQILSNELLNHQCEVIGSVLEGECAHMLQSFFSEKRNKAR